MKFLYVLGFVFVGILAFQDIRHRKINIAAAGIVWMFAVIMRSFMGASPGDIWACSILGFIFIGLSFLSKGVGRGDGFVIGMAASCMGFDKGVQVIALSFVAMCIVSLIMLILKKAVLKTALPYVPLLMAAYAAGGVLL